MGGSDSAQVAGDPNDLDSVEASPTGVDSITVNDIEELAPLRERIASMIVDCDADRGFEVELVASELVTNALEHGGVDVVHVEVRRRAEQLELTVAAADRGASGTFHPDPDVPDPHDTRGRGLVIVRALARSYRVRIEGGVRYDEVVMALDA